MAKKIWFLLAVIIASSPCFSRSKNPSLLEEQAAYYRDLGLKAQREGNIELAYQYYQKAIELDPFYASVYNDMGVIWEAKGKDSLAERFYKKALEVDPNFLAAYTNLALLYEKKGNFLEAIRYWKARYKKGKKGELWRERAKEHLIALSARFPELKKELLQEKALNLSRELALKRQKEKAKKLEEARLCFDKGLSFFNQAKYMEAQQEFKKVLELNPPDKELLKKSRQFYIESLRENLKKKASLCLNQSRSYFEQEDYLSALQELRKAQELIVQIPKNKK